MPDLPSDFPDRPRSMTRAGFIARFGGVYEHSPWVAEAVWDGGLDESHDTVAGLHGAMAAVVDRATDEQKLALIRAHPELAGGPAAGGGLTADSKGEQASAGLDRPTPDERETFHQLNRAYRERFGFPFVMAVKGRSRTEILAAFEARLQRPCDRERAAAVAEIHKIARLRLEALTERRP